VYTYIKREEGGLNSLEHCYLQITSYAKIMVEWQGSRPY
jgi:hypothetical protein